MATAARTNDGRHDTTPPWRWRGPAVAIAAIALIGGVVLRVATPSPLWLDEALSVNISQLGFGAMVDALRNDGHPSLYYLLLGWWIDIFGSSDIAVRSLSAVFSILTVPVIWLCARRYGPATANVSVLLALTSPFLLRYGSEARMYALLTMLVALGWWAAERAAEKPSPRRLLVVVAVTGALLHTHYWAFWVISAALVTLVWVIWRGDPMWRPALARVGGAIIVGSATFIVWLDVFFDQLSSTGTPWADRARPAEVVIETMQAVGGNNRFEGEFLGLVIILLVVLGAVAYSVEGDRLELRFATRSDSATAMIALTLGLGGGVALVSAGAFEARYAATVVPFLLVLAARGIAWLPARVGEVALAGVVLFGLAIGVDEARRDRTQAADVAAVIDDNIRPGDIVAFCPDQLGPATLHSLTSPVTSLAYPRGEGNFVNWSDYAQTISDLPAESFVETIVAAADGRDIWMVSGLGYKSLGNRCEAILAQMRRTHFEHNLIAPSEAFEPMLLTRLEPR